MLIRKDVSKKPLKVGRTEPVLPTKAEADDETGSTTTVFALLASPARCFGELNPLRSKPMECGIIAFDIANVSIAA